jgi:glycosyltransferase involved in cell wall biosynthesis
MKTFGMFHYKVGGTDGVSLELDKWKQVLEAMGHRVHLCGGDLGTTEGTLIEEMYHHRPDAERLNQNTFHALQDYADEAAYRAELFGLADIIERQVLQFVEREKIDFLIPQNVWSVAANPPVAIALARVMRKLNLPTLAHNHDFYWERTDGVALTCATAIELADKYLPPRDPLARHAVINSLAKTGLLARKGLESTVIPNVFNFDAPPWKMDEYNHDLRSRIGLQKHDIVILQATRIVARKGIELAIDFVRALDSGARRAIFQERGLYDGRPFDENSRIVLVLAGYAQDDVTGHYVNGLRHKIAETGIDARFIEELVGARRQIRNGEKIYSLWDTYASADFVTYPSLWEGWGNQFLEALQARLPLMIFEYPVYRADIKEKGFHVISLGSEIQGRDRRAMAQVSQSVIEAAADEAVTLLTDAQRRQKAVDLNARLGREHYSLQSLQNYLAPLVDR